MNQRNLKLDLNKILKIANNGNNEMDKTVRLAQPKTSHRVPKEAIKPMAETNTREKLNRVLKRRKGSNSIILKDT